MKSNTLSDDHKAIAQKQRAPLSFKQAFSVDSNENGLKKKGNSTDSGAWSYIQPLDAPVSQAVQ